MGDILFTVLYQPMYNLLVWFYDFLPWGGLGLSIILVTIIVKTLIFPLTFKSMKAQRDMQELQGKVAELRAKYKDNKETQAQELMKLYKEHNVNPFASCLPMVLQIVVFLTLFQVLRAGIQMVDASKLYSFVADPGTMSHIFLGIDLAAVSIPLAILTAGFQYLQARQMMQNRPPKAVRGTSGAMDEDMQATMNRTMLFVLPVLMLIMGSTTLPGGTMLYILVSTLLTLVLNRVFLKPKKTA